MAEVSVSLEYSLEMSFFLGGIGEQVTCLLRTDSKLKCLVRVPVFGISFKGTEREATGVGVPLLFDNREWEIQAKVHPDLKNVTAKSKKASSKDCRFQPHQWIFPGKPT